MEMGVFVPFSPSDINPFIEIRDANQGEYKEDLENVDYDDII